MPERVHRIAKALERQGKSESSAWAIAHATVKKMDHRKRRRAKQSLLVKDAHR